MYRVVFRNKTEEYRGVITRTYFRDQAHFNEWFDDDIKSYHEVVEEGISEERAEELCSSREATLAATRSMVVELDQTLDRILNEIHTG